MTTMTRELAPALKQLESQVRQLALADARSIAQLARDADLSTENMRRFIMARGRYGVTLRSAVRLLDELGYELVIVSAKSGQRRQTTTNAGQQLGETAVNSKK